MSRVGILVLDSITFRDICDGAYPKAEDIMQYLNTFDTLYYIDTTGYIKDANYTRNSENYAKLKNNTENKAGPEYLVQAVVNHNPKAMVRPNYTDNVLDKLVFLSIGINNEYKLFENLDTSKAKLDEYPLETLKIYTKPINTIPLYDLKNKLNTYYETLIFNKVIMERAKAAKAEADKAKEKIKDKLTKSILTMKLKYIELEKYKEAIKKAEAEEAEAIKKAEAEAIKKSRSNQKIRNSQSRSNQKSRNSQRIT